MLKKKVFERKKSLVKKDFFDFVKLAVVIRICARHILYYTYLYRFEKSSYYS